MITHHSVSSITVGASATRWTSRVVKSIRLDRYTAQTDVFSNNIRSQLKTDRYACLIIVQEKTKRAG